MAKSAEREGLSWTGAVSVVAVVAVLILVSLPRLHAFAVEENETDAASLTRSLAQALQDADDSRATLADLVADLGMEAHTDDIEWLADGRILRRHGYLFELARATPAFHPARRPAVAATVRAWPWAYGETGKTAFLGRAGEPLRRHANRGGGWSGPASPPRDGDGGWYELTAVELARW